MRIKADNHHRIYDIYVLYLFKKLYTYIIFNSIYSYPGDRNFNERAKDLIRIWNTYATLSFRKSHRFDSIARLNEIISSSRREFFEDFSIGRMVGRFDIMDNFELEGIKWKE